MAPLTRKRCVRDAHKVHIEKLIVKLQSIDETDNVAIKTIKKGIIEKMEEVKLLNGEILDLIDNDALIGNEIGESSAHSDQVNEHLVKIDSILEHNTTAETIRSLSISSSSTKPDHKVRLPKLQVSKFNGDILNFRGFWDQFNATIHSNGDLPDIEKFTYLKSLITNSAEELISGLSLSDSNYVKAIELLHDRFGNTQTLIAAHMDMLVKIPKVRSITEVKRLRFVFDTLETGIRNLNDLKVSTATYGSLLINIIFERIPEELKIIIARSFKNDNWSLDEMMKVFKEELSARERCDAVSSKSLRKFDTEETPFTSQSLYLRTSKGGKERSHDQGTFRNSNENKCVYCKRDHLSSRCSIVSDVKARVALLRRENRCFICLRFGHLAKHCKISYACVKCNKKPIALRFPQLI